MNQIKLKIKFSEPENTDVTLQGAEEQQLIMQSLSAESTFYQLLHHQNHHLHSNWFQEIQ